MKLFITTLGIILIACQSFRPALQQQGLSGFVYRESGNRMPAHNRKPASPKLLPISAELYIYRAATEAQAEGKMPEFWKINTELITHVSTDTTGYFTVALPVGEYSVFIKTNQGFYAAETDDKGILNPVTISPGNQVEKSFVMRRRAVY